VNLDAINVCAYLPLGLKTLECDHQRCYNTEWTCSCVWATHCYTDSGVYNERCITFSVLFGTINYTLVICNKPMECDHSPKQRDSTVSNRWRWMNVPFTCHLSMRPVQTGIAVAWRTAISLPVLAYCCHLTQSDKHLLPDHKQNHTMFCCHVWLDAPLI
jgi:hypothetical protein